MMEVVSALFVGTGVVLMLRYSFGKQFSDRLLWIVFLLVFFSLSILNYLADPFTVQFQVGISIIFIAVSVILIAMMPPQQIDERKKDDPLKVTPEDHNDMTKVSIIFLLLMLLSGMLYFFAI